MSLLSGINDFFGLEIGTDAVRAVQLKGSNKTKTLFRYGIMPIDQKLAFSESSNDRHNLAEAIKQFIDKSGFTTRNVAVGLPSTRVFTTLVDIDKLAPDELAKTIQYQADALIPTPLAESKLDWVYIDNSPKDNSKVEVLISSVANEFVEKQLDLLESIGLNVIAFEPESIALARAVIPVDQTTAQMVVNIGMKATNLIIAMGNGPRLIRSIPVGYESFIKAAVQNLNIEDKQAEQFVFKFGLAKDKLEGQIFNAIIGTVDVLTSEIEKSIKFFQSRYTDSKLERIIVVGSAATLPEFPLFIANKFGIAVEVGNAWRNVAFAPEQQNELIALSSHFATAVGLAERTE